MGSNLKERKAGNAVRACQLLCFEVEIGPFCIVCGKPSVGAWSYFQQRFYLAPGKVVVDPDGMAAEACCGDCAWVRHGIPQTRKLVF